MENNNGKINYNEHPEFNTNAILSSVADCIYEATHNENIYTSPINAGKSLPRFFVLEGGGNPVTEKETNETGYKKVFIDIVYEENYNLPNLYDEYRNMADKISNAIYFNLKYVIRDKDNPDTIINTFPLDAHDVETTCGQTGMHCTFNLFLRTINKDYVESKKIKKIDWEVNEKDEKENN